MSAVRTAQHAAPTRRSVETASGRISYTEAGSGPVALFVHGVLLNGHLWRHQLSELCGMRRCIALDLLAHGDTAIAADQDVSVTANATMLREFIDALQIEKVDLVGNDSGGGIAQIFAALNPERLRSLTLTDCDTHDNWPPEAFKPFLEMAAAGGLRGALEAMLADKEFYRSAQALGPAYEHPQHLSDDAIESYLRPLVSSEQRTRDLQRFLAAFDCRHTVAIEARLRELRAPTLIVWGTDDVYFDVRWSRWLAEAIPGASARRICGSEDLLSRGTRRGIQQRAIRPLARKRVTSVSVLARGGRDAGLRWRGQRHASALSFVAAMATATPMSTIYYDYLPTPIGRLLLAMDGQGLRHVHFETGRSQLEPGEDWERGTGALHEARAQLKAYFAGKLVQFDLPLAPQGTEFQQRVWLELLRIPYGETTSYGEIARRLGDLRATRAVGAANGQNPLPIIVPCHGVIGADGSLTGFGGGLPTKRFLLDHEQRYSPFTLAP